MAIYCKRTLANGVQVEYHRISLLGINVNEACTVVVRSYTGEDVRSRERAASDEELFATEEYFSCPYNDDMSVGSAYEWLKTLPQFDGAEDA